MTSEAQTVSVKLDTATRSQLQHIAEIKRRTPHWIMREAILEYVRREERKAVFREETLKAWEEYQSTGLHATAEAVDTWLASWGNDQELPVPQCHE